MFYWEISYGSKSYLIKFSPKKHKFGNKWEYWIENEEGEGMSTSEFNLFNTIDTFFKENF